VAECVRLSSQQQSAKDVERLERVATKMSSVLEPVVLAAQTASGVPAPLADVPGGCVALPDEGARSADGQMKAQ
jgi:hypothetical protein